MRSPRYLRAATVACLALSLTAMAATSTPAELTGAQIRAAFSGKIISEGAHWSIYLLPDGKTKSIELGRAHQGRWKITGHALCVSITGGAEQECWTVARTGKAYVLRADGRDLYEVTPEPPSAKYPFD
ncbi:TPA: hypothetical protein L5U93_004745 [Pseudomonas aeruginosa]|nr:hypothetical protein [Pseudomonas aeruginosa]HBP1590312.1 hypothetical protein [Pseudomonas aeruginosa]